MGRRKYPLLYIVLNKRLFLFQRKKKYCSAAKASNIWRLGRILFLYALYLRATGYLPLLPG